jgi:hypothetical protein
LEKRERERGRAPGYLDIDRSMSRLQLPEFTYNSAWLGHLPFAEWLVAALRPTTIVELGVFSGASFLAFCHAAEQLGIGTRCYGVDTWTGDDHTGFYSETVFKRLSGHIARRHHNGVELIRATFDDAAGRFGEKSVDILHIDGSHYYEAVRHDFDTWHAKVASRGVVLFHDIAVKERDFGVHRLWSEVADRFPHFAFEHSFGLGVLGVGNDIPTPVGELFDASANEEETERIRLHFKTRAGEVLKAIRPPLHIRIADRLGRRSDAVGAWRRAWRQFAESDSE